MKPRSIATLEAAIDTAENFPQPHQRRLFVALILGRDALNRVDITSENCGRQWALAKCRRHAKMLAREMEAAR